MSKRKTKKRPVLHRNRFDCIDCGLGVKVDEDGLCGGCGRQTVVIENGVPDYSLVLAGIEADEAELMRLHRRTVRFPLGETVLPGTLEIEGRVVIDATDAADGISAPAPAAPKEEGWTTTTLACGLRTSRGLERARWCLGWPRSFEGWRRPDQTPRSRSSGGG